ncbi:hypothetical protein GJ496_001006 [Pomphorhynchus laevis]|nr:hypothetical protein GJ496_001006 [Pomphorhynchus laevis]
MKHQTIPSQKDLVFCVNIYEASIVEMDDVYTCAGGKLSLNLKKSKKVIRRKIKKNNTDELSSSKAVTNQSENSKQLTEKSVDLEFLKTPAEMHFHKRRYQRLENLLKSRALKTHKQRVEEFNEKLEQLTEYNDIPKVSWTK